MIIVIKAIEIELFLLDAYSLKDKRSIIKSITQRIKQKFNVSICETKDHEIWNKSTLGIACASNSSSYCDKIITQIINFIDFDNQLEIVTIRTIL